MSDDKNKFSASDSEISGNLHESSKFNLDTYSKSRKVFVKGYHKIGIGVLSSF